MRHLAFVFVVGCWRSSPPADPIASTPPDAAADAALVAEAPPVDAPPSAPPAPCVGGIVARVIRISVQGNELVATVAAGSNLGVGKTWLATFENRNAPIIRIDATRTMIRVRGTPDQIKASPYVVLCPP